MKKSVFLMGMIALLAFASCNGGSSVKSTGSDSTLVAFDSTLAIDSLSVGSMGLLRDTVATDTTKK